MITTVRGNVMDFTWLSAKIVGSDHCSRFDTPAIPNLMRLAKLPVLAFKGQIGRKRILIGKIG